MELTGRIKHIAVGILLALPMLAYGQEKDHTPGAQGVQATVGFGGSDREDISTLIIFDLGYYRWITERFFLRGTLYTVRALDVSEEGSAGNAADEPFAWYGGDVAAVYNPLMLTQKMYFNVFAGLSLAGDAETSSFPLMPGAFVGGEIEIRIAGAFFLIVSGKGNYIISKLNRGWWPSVEMGFKYGF